ncbi:ArnT family glycosyltransferase [Candidatus Omnitrophota bacterium]
MKFIEKRQYIVILIFLLAFAVRLAFVLQDNVNPSSDAYVYDSLGMSISQGNGYVNSNGTPHSFYPPFYPFFLSLIYRIFGHSYVAVRIIQSLIGAFVCALIYLIGKRMHSFTAGIIAGISAIAYLPFIKTADLLLTEGIFTFLLLLIVFYLLKISADLKPMNCIVLGLLLGISLLTKSAMLFFPVFMIPAFYYIEKESLSTVFKKYALVLVFFLLPVIPWTIRNYNVYHEFVPVATQTGIGFYSSYCPPDGVFGRLATPNTDTVVREAAEISSLALRSNFLIKKTLEFIMYNPKLVLALEFKKFVYFWVPFDWEIIGGRWFNFAYVAMFPFFIMGLSIAFRELRKFYIILLPIVYFQIMTLIFYGSPRFRLPIEPYIFILAAIGAIEIYKNLHDAGRKDS